MISLSDVVFKRPLFRYSKKDAFAPQYRSHSPAGSAGHGLLADFRLGKGAGAGAHDHSVRLHDVHHEAGTHDSSAHVDHHGYEQAGGDLDNHCCPGHVLGHLSAGLGATLQLPFAPAAQAAVAGSQQRFSSRVPDGLDQSRRLIRGGLSRPYSVV